MSMDFSIFSAMGNDNLSETEIAPIRPNIRPATCAAFVRIAIYLVLVTTPPLLSAVLPSAGEAHGFGQQLANTLALLGYSIVSLQFVLSARLKWIEWPFGLDMLLKFHKAMAVFAGLLLLSHPVLMAWGGDEWSLLTRVSAAWPIQVGRAAMLALLATIVVSCWRVAFRLSYERWRVLHNVFALGVLMLGFVHSISIGMDLQTWVPRALWGSYLAAALAAYTYHRFICPCRQQKRPYKVVEIWQETHNVTTIKLQPMENDVLFDYLPGQFHFVTLYSEKLAVEEHPFTISSSPTQPGIVTSTIKQSGNFTATIGQAKVGDRVALRGPFGRFCHLLHPGETELVFVAGGVGITPLMSMLRYMRDADQWKPVLLIVSNRTHQDILFREELDEMARTANSTLSVVHVLSNPGDDWGGDRGRVDRELILRHVGERLSEKAFYICGPHGMTRSVLSVLGTLSVSPSNIHTEQFSF